jgi:hypothetical protein
MKIPIPIFDGNSIYTDCEIKKPKGGDLATAQEVLQQGESFRAIAAFLEGGINSFSGEKGEVVDRGQIKGLIKRLPYRSAEFLCLKILLLLGTEDGIEAIYQCPRCKKSLIAELNQLTGVDTRNFISEFTINNMEDITPTFRIALTESIDIIDKRDGTLLDSYMAIDLQWPTLEHAMRASAKFGDSQAIRRQYAIYTEALTKINDEIVTEKIRNQWGMYIFEHMDTRTDLKAVSDMIQKYGVDQTVKKHCPACGKDWSAVVDTSNFFVSGLGM